jgi:hypothetical protein
MLKKIIQSRQLYLLLGIFSIFVFLFSRTFMGVFILSYRTGEIVFFLSLFFFLLSIFINPGILLKNKTWPNQIRYTLLLLVIHFLFSVITSKGSFTDLYIYRSSSYIWSIGFLYLSLIIFEKRKPSVNYMYALIASLVWIYIYNIYGLSDQLQNLLLIISDKFEYHKGSDLLIMFVVTFFVINRMIVNKRTTFEIFIVFSSLYLPILLFKSRSAFIAFFIFFILEIIYLKPAIGNQTKRNFILFIVSTLILIQSIFIVTKSGYIQIEEISIRAEQIIDYRLTIPSESEKSFLYIEDAKIYSTDGNLNWRLQIWQDVLFDLADNNKLSTGYGFISIIPAMDDPIRRGEDGTNENVHNFLINILARAGVIGLLLYLSFFFFLFKEITKTSNNFQVFNLVTPIFITSLFDASMENSHFPILLYITIGLYIQNLTKN